MAKQAVWIGAFVALAFAGSVRADTTSDLVKKGQYLATAGDCISCHTAPGGKPLAGGLRVSTPFGPMVTPNITPDKDTGIGGYSDDQFYKALHEGIGQNGEYLYPVFPFQWYTHVSRDDVMAIKAYLFSVPPVHAEQKVNQLNFPFSIRASLLGWRQLFFTEGEFKPDPSKSAQINRGKYLVTGLGHCGECHTEHNALGGTEKKEAFEGATIDGWYAPNITSDMQEGIGSWSQGQLVSYLKTGVAPGKGIVAGPMAEVVTESLSKLNDSDIAAIAAYLKSIPAKKSFSDTRPTAAADATPPGAGTYATFCASCHQGDGMGIAGVVPALKGNGAVLAKGPEDVISTVIGGLPAKADYAPMPAIGAGMTDQQVAEAANYVRTAWTNRAPDNAQAGEVADLRKKTTTMLAGADCLPAPAALTDAKSGIGALLSGMTEVNMLNRVGEIVAKAKAAQPQAGKAELVNDLTAAYCPILKQDASVAQDHKPEQLATFSQLVYTRIAQPHERW
jgi:mono/diheme cytochrome c family protein